MAHSTSVQRGLIAALGAAAMLLTPSALIAQGRPDTGNTLLTDCKNDDVTWSDGFCAGTIKGVVAGMYLASTLHSQKAPWCARDSVTNGQTRDVVVAWLRAHPSERDLPTAIVIARAMKDAFPCS
jgi:hypothetical protein